MNWWVWLSGHTHVKVSKIQQKFVKKNIFGGKSSSFLGEVVFNFKKIELCDTIKLKKIILNRSICDFTQLPVQIVFFYSNGISHIILFIHVRYMHKEYLSQTVSTVPTPVSNFVRNCVLTRAPHSHSHRLIHAPLSHHLILFLHQSILHPYVCVFLFDFIVNTSKEW